MTLTTKSGNRVTVAFMLFGERIGKIDLKWESYPPSEADVKECTRWIEVDLLPGQARVGGHLFDVKKGQN